ncbi:MAG TPA: Glu-tRNA(Gln) amidotransferase subunit GatE [Nitrososphaerales archaeon]|nr:Glu-tRNA(Gln) amidotransferase subunit GatE [Nitrososphaerales archaeon]
MKPGAAEVKVGLEVHQQLASPTKLFCACPIRKSEVLPHSFMRRLRPAQSEVGKVDPAALFEFTKGREIQYLWSPDSSCLVEADEEPPHPMGAESLEAALMVAAALRSEVVEEIHVMRKIVIDGSNTSGFQRTAVVGLGGSMLVDGVKVGVQSVTVEEDAARIIGEGSGMRSYALDRLGVPLVEVALDPVSGSPEIVGKVALHLGRTLRSTGKVARGLGTIRQDLNVSVGGGAVVEVKGVQKLNLVPKVVDYEVRRQSALIEVAEELKSRRVKVVCTETDVTTAMKKSGSTVLRRRAEEGSVVCIAASGLRGLLGRESTPGIRLGREVAEVARANSLGGVIHSDEFEKQGIGGAEESELRGMLKCADDSALVLVAGPGEVVDRVVPALKARLEASVYGVPAETRYATDEGETRYMRPRPGAQRMYPETDIPDVVISAERLTGLKRNAAGSWEERVRRLTSKYGLSEEMALRVFDDGAEEDFIGTLSRVKLSPSFVATVLVDFPPRLSREGVPESVLGVETLAESLKAVERGLIAKEAVPEVLRILGKDGGTVETAIASMGLKSVDEGEVRRIVDRVVSNATALVKERGEDAFGPLMGEAMRELRGRADGAVVGRILSQRLKEATENPKQQNGS